MEITPYLKISGVDVTKYIAEGGLKWSRNDIDSANAGRTLSGLMNRGRVCQKFKLEVKCKPLLTSETQVLLKLINPEYVTVDYIDPMLGERTGVQFYSNNVPASLLFIDPDGVGHWKDISFPLVER